MKFLLYKMSIKRLIIVLTVESRTARSAPPQKDEKRITNLPWWQEPTPGKSVKTIDNRFDRGEQIARSAPPQKDEKRITNLPWWRNR